MSGMKVIERLNGNFAIYTKAAFAEALKLERYCDRFGISTEMWLADHRRAKAARKGDEKALAFAIEVLHVCVARETFDAYALYLLID